MCEESEKRLLLLTLSENCVLTTHIKFWNMTVSKWVAKFEKNIGRRGVGPITSNKPLEPAHIVLILFAVLVVASFIFQVVRMAMNDGVPEQDS